MIFSVNGYKFTPLCFYHEQLILLLNVVIPLLRRIGFLAAILLIPPVFAENNELYFPPASEFFTSIDDRQHIPDKIVTKLVQDTHGRLWIGSAGGLVRYDGYRFRRYIQQSQQAEPATGAAQPGSHNSQHGLAGNFVRHLLQSSNGELWLATAPGGIQRYNNATDSFYQPKISTPGITADFGSQVQAITEDNNGNIWLAGNLGIALLDQNDQVKQFIPPQEGLEDIRAMLTDSQGNLWLGSRNGLFILTPGSASAKPVSGPDGQLGQVLTLAKVADSIWLGTDRDGAFVIQNNRSLTAIAPQVTISGPVYDILQVTADEVWLAGFAGITRVNAIDKRIIGRFQHDISNPFSLGHQDIRTLLQDNAGKIWLGGYGGGLQRYDGQPGVSTLRHSLIDESSISSGNISSILQLANGQIWLGSRGDGIDVIAPDSGIVAQHKPDNDIAGKLQHGWITAMEEQADGTIWVGVNPGQLYRYHTSTNQFSLLGPEHGIWRTNVRSLFVDSQQRLWLGSSTGLALWQPEQQRFVRIKQHDGEPLQDYINAITEDASQNIWLGTGASGLYRVAPATDSTNPPSARAILTEPVSSILGILYDSQNRLWLDTPTGLFQFDYQQHSQNKPNALSKAVIADNSLNEDFGANLLEDEHGNIWTSKYRYSPDSAQLYQLNPADGVNIGSPWYRAYFKTRQGLLLFGGSTGLLVIDPDKFRPWQFQPQVLLAELRVQGRSRHIAPDLQALTLQADERSFSVEFSASDLSAPQLLQYRHRLLGFDQDWQYSDASQRLASYTNLWPGNYQLQIQATNRAGQWSPLQAGILLTVKPAFWQQWWFGVLVALAILLAIYLLVQMRTRVAKVQAQQLAQMVEERSQQLKLAQQRLLENEKMAALGQTVAGVAHEINTPVGVSITASSALAGKLAELKQHFDNKTLSAKAFSLFVSDSEQHLQLIGYNLQRAADLVTQFKQLAVDESATDSSLIKLKPWLQHLIARLNPPNDDIVIILQCPDNLNLQLRASALATVLSHLLENALIHAFDAGTTGEIKLQVSCQRQQLLITVTDNGKGIDSSIKDNVFNPFVTTRRASHSKGLGLHLCYNLVTQVLMGTIDMKTEAGTGCTFTLALPLDADKPNNGHTNENMG